MHILKAAGVALAAMLALSSLPSVSARAQSVEAFYKANRLTVVIGYTPGAVYDLYARTVARHIGKYIPGRPAVIPQNMPGAGSMNAANFIYTKAPKDGSQIATFARGLAMQQLLDDQGVQYDAPRLNWLGSPATEVSVLFSWHSKPFKTMDDVTGREMIVPATGTGADSAIFPYVMNGVLETKFKVVGGYPGAAETMLSIERGETDGSAGTSWGNFASTKADWIKEKKVNIILQLAIKKHPYRQRPAGDGIREDGDRQEGFGTDILPAVDGLSVRGAPGRSGGPLASPAAGLHGHPQGPRVPGRCATAEARHRPRWGR
jgi:hypothetical protein